MKKLNIYILISICLLFSILLTSCGKNELLYQDPNNTVNYDDISVTHISDCTIKGYFIDTDNISTNSASPKTETTYWALIYKYSLNQQLPSDAIKLNNKSFNFNNLDYIPKVIKILKDTEEIMIFPFSASDFINPDSSEVNFRFKLLNNNSNAGVNKNIEVCGLKTVKEENKIQRNIFSAKSQTTVIMNNTIINSSPKTIINIDNMSSEMINNRLEKEFGILLKCNVNYINEKINSNEDLLENVDAENCSNEDFLNPQDVEDIVLDNEHVFTLPYPENIQYRELSESTIEISWNPVVNATKYAIYLNDKFLSYSCENCFTLEDLERNSDYFFNISTINEVGNGPVSPDYNITTNCDLQINLISKLIEEKKLINTFSLKNPIEDSSEININYYYSLNNGISFTKTENITGDILIDQNKDYFTINWNYFDEISDTNENVIIKIEPVDKKGKGICAISSPINCYYNFPGRLSNLFVSENIEDINIRFELNDENTFNTGKLRLFYSLGKDQFKESTHITGNLINIDDGVNAIVWNSKEDFKTKEENVKIKIVLMDNNIMLSLLESDTISINNNTPPEISNILLTNNQGTININFDLEDTENNICDLEFAYSLNNGLTYNTTSNISNLTKFNSNNNVNIYWDSFKDFSGEENVIIKLIPHDGTVYGNASSTDSTYIDNRFPPEITNVYTKGNRGNIDVFFNVADINNDTVNVTLNYSTDGGTTFNPCTVTGISDFTPSYNNKITWNSGSDVVNSYSKVIIKVTGNDSYSECSESTSEFFISNTSENKDFTFLIYMAADNNLSDVNIGNNVYRDINRYESADSGSNINIVVEYDALETSGGKRYIIENDNDLNTINSTIFEEFPEADTGDYLHALDFFKKSIDLFPAENYVICFWGHGSGWYKGVTEPSNTAPRRSVANDETSGGHNITLTETGLIMSNLKQYIGKNIDVLIYNTCVSQEIESAYQVKDSVNYQVGSQLATYGFSFTETFNYLQANTDTTADTLCQKFTEFNETYVNSMSLDSSECYSVSTIKLAETNNLLNSLNSLCSALISLSDTNISEYYKIIYNTQSASYIDEDTSEEYGQELKDLGHFCQLLITEFPGTSIETNAQNVLNAISDYVIYSFNLNTIKPDLTGFSIYLPEPNQADIYWSDYYQVKYDYQELAFAKESRWIYLLNTLY